MQKISTCKASKSIYKSIAVQKINPHLYINYPYGTTRYSISLYSSQLIPLDILENNLSEKFYYEYTLEPNSKGEFVTSIYFDENTVNELKFIIPILMQYAHHNSVWSCLTTEDEICGMHMPEYILALIKEKYILGFDFSVILI
ncbi:MULTISPECIES: hypothetical protein [unclassified Acinetobacter]|uniref:hypothetical protein n=1 Tax=unclassified Acinetobacter TaxID=196816 RepID=UPI0035BA11D7